MRVRSLLVVFLFLIAANVPFWIASHSLGLLMRGVFNIDVVVVGIVSLLVRRRVAALLLLVGLMVLDIVQSIGATYLMSPGEMLSSLRYSSGAAPAHGWAVATVAVCIGAVALMMFAAFDERLNRGERGSIVTILLLFGVLCGTWDAVSGHTAMFRPDRQLSTLRLTRFPVHALGVQELEDAKHRYSITEWTDASAPAASAQMRFETVSEGLQRNKTQPDVVLILVESWGESMTADLEKALIRPYFDQGLSAKYTLSQGAVPFYGPTVAGEARELCGSAAGFALLTATPDQLRNCLPARMKKTGYHSVAIHGFLGEMFDRREWYPRIGFDEVWFRDRLEGAGLPLCPGPFPGACDAAVSKWIGGRLREDSASPRFIYWLTLNSHLPVPVPNAVENPPSCRDIPIAAQSSAICSWYQLEFNVHRSVASLAMKVASRPTVFLIVGDHRPPFSSSELRSRFSDKVVPYILLTPKEDGMKEDRPALRSVAEATPLPESVTHPKLKKGKPVGTSAGS